MLNHHPLTARNLRSVDEAIARLLKGSALDQAVASLLLAKRAQGCSGKTLIYYQCTLARFARWMAGEGHPTGDLPAITALHIRLFLDYIRQSPIRPGSPPPTPTDAKPGTVHAYGRAVRHFFNWLVDEELIRTNPMVGSRAGRSRVPLPHVPDSQIVPFSEEQIEKLLAACNLGTKLGLRNAALIMLMLDTGLRSSEVCRIRIEDYNPMSGVVQVQSAKGGSERTAVLSPASRRAVNRWVVQGRQNYGNPPETLFISLVGREPDALTPNGLGQVVRELGKAAGITGVRCSPHTLRHTFACFYLLNGGDIESLRQFMGHSTISMTIKYLHLQGKQLEDLHRRFAPAARLDSAAVSRLRRAAGHVVPNRKDDDEEDQPALGAGPTCTVPGCDRHAKAQGWCSAHHQRKHLYGDVRADIPIQQRGADPPPKACERCGEPIPAKALRAHPDQRFCGADCSRAARYEGLKKR